MKAYPALFEGEGGVGGGQKIEEQHFQYGLTQYLKFIAHILSNTAECFSCTMTSYFKQILMIDTDARIHRKVMNRHFCHP